MPNHIDYYDTMWFRAPSYLVGIWVGWYLHVTKESPVRLSKVGHYLVCSNDLTCTVQYICLQIFFYFRMGNCHCSWSFCRPRSVALHHRWKNDGVVADLQNDLPAVAPDPLGYGGWLDRLFVFQRLRRLITC